MFSSEGHYVYVMMYPDGTPFYVGFGKIGRTYSFPHNNAAALKVRREIEFAGNKIKKTRERFSSAEAAKAREKELIEKYGRRDDGGLLCNIRVGDRGGIVGRPRSAETRAKISEKMRGRHA